MNIYYFTPYSIEKNLGKAMNDHCRLVPNDSDWIVILDGDAMFLQPDWGVIIHKALEKDGHKFGLIGCYTNRLRGLHQLHEGKFSDDHNIKNHIEIAKTYAGKEGIKDLQINGVAGIFMAFQKSTWSKAGKFQENSITADTNFNLKVRKLRMKIGIIEGLYIYHTYRPWKDAKDKPWDCIKHLQK